MPQLQLQPRTTMLDCYNVQAEWVQGQGHRSTEWLSCSSTFSFEQAHTTDNTSPGGCDRCGTTLHANSSQFGQVRAMPALRGRRGARVLRGVPWRWLRSLLPSKQHRRLRVRLGQRCGGSVAALLVLLRRTGCGVIQLGQVQVLRALHSNSASFCVCVTGREPGLSL